jgi:N-acetylneuraminate synthase
LENKIQFIAEIGINHNGDLNEAKRLIDTAISIKADFIKFQMRDFNSLYPNAILDNSSLAESGTQYIIDELKRTHLTFEQIEHLKKYTEEKTIKSKFLLSAFDISSLEKASQLGLDTIKIGSPDFDNIFLIDKAAELFDHLILSTGMNNHQTILKINNILKNKHCRYSFLLCNSTYPSSIENTNINYLETLKSLDGPYSIGYSGHSSDISASLAAVSRGAEIIEKHLTHDTNDIGQDHSSSIEHHQFKELIRISNEMRLSFGENKKVVSQGEIMNKLTLGKSLVFSRAMKKGELVEIADLVAKSPAKGISPLRRDEFLGRELIYSVEKDEYLSENHFVEKLKPVFSIPKKWGLVGRLFDFDEFLCTKPDLIEIHLTWRDLVNYHLFKKKFEHHFHQDLVVHAPEYYYDELVDFAGNNCDIADASVAMLQQVVDFTKEIQTKFKGVDQNKGARIVVHPGGHFKNFTLGNKNEQYRLLLKNLSRVNTEGVRILIENMPPNPWYFGGRWHNTIFMDSNEIALFAKKIDWGICYDLSHALLYCNHSNQTITKFSNNLFGHIEYLHIADGLGVNQEGLQLGEGNLDLNHVIELIHQLDVGFIPEIWNGHLNSGEGFFKALNVIEEMLKKKLSSKSCMHHHISTVDDHKRL